MATPVASGNMNELINQYEKYNLANYFILDPRAGLVPRTVFDTSNGVEPIVTVLGGSLPTAYPSALQNLNITSGPGNPSGDVVPVRVTSGQTNRTYQLEQHSWASNIINQSDTTFREQAVEVLKNIRSNMQQFTLVHNRDWHSFKSLGMIDNKAVVTGTGQIVEASNSDFSFNAIVVDREALAQAGTNNTITLDGAASAVNGTFVGQDICIISGTGGPAQKRTITGYVGATKVATVDSNWTVNPDVTSTFRILTTDLPADIPDWKNVLRPLRLGIDRRGGEAFALGRSSRGEHIYALTLGTELIEILYQDELQSDIRYFESAANFNKRGITQAVRGFAPNEDLFAKRWDACFNLIYPFINVAVTHGQEFRLNPDWLPADNSPNAGNAVYESGEIYTREIWEGRPRPQDPVSWDMAKFKPQNYTAQLDWLTPPGIDAVNDNPFGNKGYFQARWAVGARPIRPDLGQSLMYKIPSLV